MPILDLQKRARELGRIRIGQQAPFTRKDGSSGVRPAKLDRFRLTSASKPLLDKVAQLYGGTVAEWTPSGGTPQWEVVTDAARIPIMVPPQPVTQWMETWSRAGCVHRCDGHTNVLTDEPCDPDDPNHLNAAPTTRLNVVLRDVEGIGVWRLESHGWNAAMELPQAAEFLAQAGGYVNGWVALEARTSRKIDGDTVETYRYMVPTIEIDVTPAQLMAGHGRVAAPALTGGPVGETPALAAAGPDYVALAADLETPAEVTALWNRAHAAGHMTDGLNSHLHQRHADLTAAAQTGQAAGGPPAPQQEEVAHPVAASSTAAPPPAEPEPQSDVVDGEVVEDPPGWDDPLGEPPPVAPPLAQPPLEPPAPAAPAAAASVPAAAAPALDTTDADAVWERVLAEAGRRNITLPDLQDDVTTFFGGTLTSAEASGAELAEYLADLAARR